MVQIVKKILTQTNSPSFESYLRYANKVYDLDIKINKSKRVHRITLRVCQFSGELRLTVPPLIRVGAFSNFIEQHLDWINLQKAKIIKQIQISEGIKIPIFGLERIILSDSECWEDYSLTSEKLTVPTPIFQTRHKINFKDQVKNVLIQLSNEFFNDVCQRDSAKLGVSFSKISYKDPKSRWGSCSSERKLMFSWRLIMAPREVSAYVAAHEVAHLVHMNHSKSFWETVRFLCPDYMSHRVWLRYNGKMLHRFIF